MKEKMSRTRQKLLCETKAVDMVITGIVQGVGFRPFVYRLALAHGITGYVKNTPEGVFLHAEGKEDALFAFQESISASPPPVSRITGIQQTPAPCNGYGDFAIHSSREAAKRVALISPDTAVCTDCLKEMFDPEDRRFQYPFINCTNCGPRYTIIEDIPYDRPFTTMDEFTMCDACMEEYNSYENRRFHAQPNACPVCGPKVFLETAKGTPVHTDDPIGETARILKKGQIVAVKGLGGFHLACDALNTQAVKTLRDRKKRDEKPFALMSYDLDTIKTFARVTDHAEKLLTSVERPVVLVEKKENHLISREVAPGNHYFGVMLPYTPLHYLLLSKGFTALVMTSANLSEEPIVIENNEARERLCGIADFLLLHNREILVRTDDSVIAPFDDKNFMIRRSRGYVPVPVFLSKKGRMALGVGGHLKNTFCLTKDDRAFLSQHIGDMENAKAEAFFLETVDHLETILEITPEVVAHDMHPDYSTTKYALLRGLPLVPVQHHHAHILSCMAENQVDDPVIGLSFDGTGYGPDNAVWGGEVMIAEPGGYSRVSHLAYLPLPGASGAVKEPWRMGVSYLFREYGENMWDLPLPFIRHLDREKTRVLVQMMEKGINSPQTSSMGRLFDGVAAILNLRMINAFEGQAAMELEFAAAKDRERTYPYPLSPEKGRPVEISPLIQGVVQDIQEGLPLPVISATFHNTIVRIFSQFVREISRETGIRKVALSGGVFQNKRLITGFLRELSDMKALTHTLVPPNDGGICLGQVRAAMEKG